MAQLIDGKKISKEIKDELKAEVEKLKSEGKKICLAVIQVGNDPASSVYVNNKKKACAYIGIESEAYELEESIPEAQLLEFLIHCSSLLFLIFSVCANTLCFLDKGSDTL